MFRTQLVSARTKLYLVYLADFMDAGRRVSRERRLVAADLGVGERTVDRMTNEARDGGFLSTIVPGRKGVTAVYQGLFPTSQRDSSCRAELDADDLSQRDSYGGPEMSETVALKPRSARQHVGAPVVTTDAPSTCPYHADDGLPCPTDCRGYSPSSNEEAAS
ncbi:hypothetical protein [Nocardioides immobilis]|uniref:hypothetical protein n=1 Tax=Nocardioides immobilis TaxID=2049295 RepID=UPI0011C3E95B|nr:hypothetical protein [Nocardioides immobilis]